MKGCWVTGGAKTKGTPVRWHSQETTSAPEDLPILAG